MSSGVLELYIYSEVMVAIIILYGFLFLLVSLGSVSSCVLKTVICLLAIHVFHSCSFLFLVLSSRRVGVLSGDGNVCSAGSYACCC